MSTDTETTTPVASQSEDAELVGIAYTLTVRKTQYPQLVRAEAQARLRLAAAIAALDETEDRIEAGMAIHSLNEQLAVERAKDDYAQALADLVRGQLAHIDS